MRINENARPKGPKEAQPSGVSPGNNQQNAMSPERAAFLIFAPTRNPAASFRLHRQSQFSGPMFEGYLQNKRCLLMNGHRCLNNRLF